jgi:hypothetical protein
MADEPNIAELEARVKASQDAQLQDAIKFVMLGFGDDFGLAFRSLNFRTELLNTEQTQVVVRLIKEYGWFKGADVADALAPFKGRVRGYEFGRDGKPVLYINLPPWTHHQEGSYPWVKKPSRRVTVAEKNALVAELRAALPRFTEFGFTDVPTAARIAEFNGELGVLGGAQMTEEDYKQHLRVYWT